ncbi:MAG: clpS [Labilithrix sp.]|nr:clpS [Labilithrix sp.]
MGVRLDAEATRLVDEARALARRYGHELVEPEHLLRALATDTRATELRPWMQSAVDVAGGNGPAIRTALEAHMTSTTLLHRLNLAVASNGNRESLVTGVLQSPALARIFAEHGVTPFALRRALVRRSGGELDDTSLPDGDERVEIVFHNDDYTTMEFVIDVLGRCFAISPPDSTRSMLVVHQNGAAVVKTCAATEARWRIEKGRAFARAAEMPLRITWRRVAADEPDRDS